MDNNKKNYSLLGLLGVTRKSPKGQGIIMLPCRQPMAGRRVTEYALTFRLSFYGNSLAIGQCSRLSRWRLGFNSLARQIFKLTFSPSPPSPPVAITKPSSLD